jgi:hypothetical protein
MQYLIHFCSVTSFPGNNHNWEDRGALNTRILNTVRHTDRGTQNKVSKELWEHIQESTCFPRGMKENIKFLLEMVWKLFYILEMILSLILGE